MTHLTFFQIVEELSIRCGGSSIFLNGLHISVILLHVWNSAIGFSRADICWGEVFKGILAWSILLQITIVVLLNSLGFKSTHYLTCCPEESKKWRWTIQLSNNPVSWILLYSPSRKNLSQIPHDQLETKELSGHWSSRGSGSMREDIPLQKVFYHQALLSKH